MSQHRPLSEAHRQAISRAQTGKTGYWSGKTLTPAHRRHISEGSMGKTYTPEAIASFRKRRRSEETCRKIAESQYGEKAAAWKGGRSSAQVIARGRSRGWRKRVLERDGRRCRHCGATRSEGNRPLNAHHVFDFRTHPELRYEVWNGITLCAECHKEDERRIREAKRAQKSFAFISHSPTGKEKRGEPFRLSPA